VHAHTLKAAKCPKSHRLGVGSLIDPAPIPLAPRNLSSSKEPGSLGSFLFLLLLLGSLEQRAKTFSLFSLNHDHFSIEDIETLACRLTIELHAIHRVPTIVFNFSNFFNFYLSRR